MEKLNAEGRSAMRMADRESRSLRRGGALLVLAGALLLEACATQNAETGEKMTDRLKRMQESAAAAVAEDMQKQVVPPGRETSPIPEGASHLLKPGEPIWIQSGKSRVVQVQGRIERISVSNPEMAGIVVLGPTSFQINAKILPEKQETQPAAGGVGSIGGGMYLGRTLTPEPRLAETTITIWTGEGIEVHTLTVADFINQQVMLEVTVAEVNRTALETHGIDWRIVQNDLIAAGFLAGGLPPQTLTTVPPQINQPLLPLTVGGDAPTYALIFPDEDVTVFLNMLQTEGLATILAQPKLLALSGQTAVFQVGGEIPIRISTAFTTDIAFKVFGTLVNFVPTVSDEGDIMLTVTPEVSEPDFSRTVEGIPSFRTRRASTSTRLRNGQTLIIGGLLQTRTQEEVSGVPYMKDIPYLGYVFRETSYVTEVTELLVVVKPSLVRPLPPQTELALPTERGPLSKEDVRTKKSDAEAARPRLPLLP